MIVENVDRRTLRAAVQLACRAPSVHNSQPWRWRIGPHGVELRADLRRWLPATDADGRDLVVSCGAALHHLRVALAATGQRTIVHRFPDYERPDHLATVELVAGPPAEADLGLATVIPHRRSDRRRFSDWEIPDAIVGELIAAAPQQGALLVIVDDAATRSVLTATIREAAALQEQTPGYATETAVWTGRTTGVDGVPAANVPRVAGEGQRRFAAGTLEQVDADVPDGALLAVLGTASDDPLSQLRAGEALSAVTLQAGLAGLASCPLSQVLEVEGTRATLRDDVLSGALCPQLMLRLGWAPPAILPPTPRRPVDEVLDAGLDQAPSRR